MLNQEISDDDEASRLGPNPERNPAEISKFKKLHLVVPELTLQAELRGILQQNDFMIAPMSDADVVIFASTESELSAMADLANTLRECTRRPHLLVCVPLISPSDKAKLGKGFISRFVSAPTTSAQSIAARVLAELFVFNKPAPLSGYFCGCSLKIRNLQRMLIRFGQIDASVLLLGESGSGKELCAQLLSDSRKKGKLVSVNCSSFKAELAESELFGHVAGAFTGAQKKKEGYFETVGNGTLFLDEIGNLSYEAQGTLLRVLDNSTYRPVGSQREHQSAARVVLATNLDLPLEVEEKRFRHDLYYRIKNFTVRLPALRERMEDVPLLVNFFIASFNRRDGRNVLPPKSYDAFFRYSWPGNVRELRGLLERVYVLDGNDQQPLDSAALETHIDQERQQQNARMRHMSSGAGDIAPITLHENPVVANDIEERASIAYYPGSDSWPDLEERAKRQFFGDAFKTCGFKVTEQLKELSGLSRSRLYDVLREFDLLPSKGKDK